MTSLIPINTDRNAKIDTIRKALQEDGLQGVVVTSQGSLSWIFGGRYHVGIATEQSIAQILIRLDCIECLVSNNEHERLINEEGLVADVHHVYPWYDESRKHRQEELWRGMQNVVFESDWGKLRELRTKFAVDQIQDIHDFAKVAARAVEEVCKQLYPQDTECEAAGRIASNCYSNGLDPITVLVAGERRAKVDRHPLPSREAIGQFAILSLCARYSGIVVSLTRMIAFSAVPPEIKRLHESVQRIDATLIHATRPGRTMGELVQVAIDGYTHEGIPDGWKEHHQGGLAGYQSRELRAVPQGMDQVHVNQLYAWNPTLPGVKSEDTILVGEMGTVVLTQTDDYPVDCINVAGELLLRPTILIR